MKNRGTRLKRIEGEREKMRLGRGTMPKRRFVERKCNRTDSRAFLVEGMGVGCVKKIEFGLEKRRKRKKKKKNKKKKKEKRKHRKRKILGDHRLSPIPFAK